DRIYLKEISTNMVTPDLLQYLASYSGLENISISRPDGGSRDKSDHLADMFYSHVLPRHARSLLQLSCPAGYESRWSFGTHNVDVVAWMNKLMSLHMTIN
ncbi:hypothetical protein C8R43DRAFT_847381, partial [Mycena crocata]